MATRSFIGKALSDGRVQGIYCHFDGYPDGVGATLNESYTSPEKVDALLALGDISSLGPEIGEAQDFNKPNEGWTVAYHRDRGEVLATNKFYATVRDLIRNAMSDMGAEYCYVFRDGKWESYET